MAAKRKNVPPKDDADREQRFMDGLMASIMETEEGTAWVKAFIEETNNPGIAKKRKRNEARQEAFHSFLRYLDELPAGHALPKGFQSNWLKWLSRFEREETAKLLPKDRAPDRVGKWVKLAWITTALNDSDELQTGRFIYHDKQPSADIHPIPVILIHQKGQWRLSAEQMLAATAHPYVRAFCHSLPALTDKAAVLGQMRWALDLEGKPNSPESQLKDAAHNLHAAFSGDILECLPDPLDRCVPFDQLPESAPLWKLLDAAIGFGRMLQHQEIFGDGVVETILSKGIKSEIGITPRKAIARLMDDYFNEKGFEATSTGLLEWLGVTRPKSDGKPIIFPDHRGDALRNICWTEFNLTVKNEKRSR